MVNARLESSGFEDIGQRNGTSIDSPLLSMLRRMPSSDLGEISYTKIFNPSPSPKPLLKASTLAWSVDLSLLMPTHLLCYGVVTTIYSSATISLQKSQLRRTRRALDSISALVRLLQGLMAPDTSPTYLLFQTLFPLFWTLICMIE